MPNQLSHLLKQWFTHKDETEWVLGTITEIAGSSYRKPGAMMFFSGLGQQLGLLSGGCLEADIMRHARTVMADGQSKSITYDMQDEDDIAWQLGIGCGGRVKIQLDLIHRSSAYLQLDKLHQHLEAQQHAWFALPLEPRQATVGPRLYTQADISPPFRVDKTRQIDDEQGAWLVTPVKPPPHLLVFGGGLDARPMASIANELGWRVTLVDHRCAYARAAHFPSVSQILRTKAAQLSAEILTSIDAAVVMNHNIEMDAQALRALVHSNATYIALLGPRHRCRQVLEAAALGEQRLPAKLASPAGFNIGGELPESIALATLAECHAALEGAINNKLSSLV